MSKKNNEVLGLILLMVLSGGTATPFILLMWLLAERGGPRK